MQIIQELETSPRKLYTGAIGYLTPQQHGQFNVAIRTILIDRASGQAEYGVGSGIVWDSDAQQEYAECQVKTLLLSQRQPDFSLLETLRWTPEDHYALLTYHLRRLQNSAEYFGFPLAVDEIQQALEDFQKTLTPVPHKVRLLVDRWGRWTLDASLWTLPGKLPPVRLCLAPTPIPSANPFLYHKTTERSLYESARAACPDCDDVLLWNEAGEVTESCIANVVVQMGGGWYTPPVRSGLLAGTFRAWLLEQQQIEERVMTVDDVKQAERLYLINSLRGWREAVLVR